MFHDFPVIDWDDIKISSFYSQVGMKPLGRFSTSIPLDESTP